MSQFALKFLALFFMLLDHTAKIVLRRSLLTPVFGAEYTLVLRTCMISLGHIALPLFAWFTAEGCRKTSNPRKYLLRLGLFALLSEIPFQLCFFNSWHFGCRNVIFTLLLAAAAIFLVQEMQKRGYPWAVSLPVYGTAVFLGYFLHTDYNAWGVALVLLLYVMPNKRSRLITLSVWITVFRLIWHGWNQGSFLWLDPGGASQLAEWAGCMCSVPLLATYNGSRGRGGRWLFYVFYPCHLLVLYCIWTFVLS